MYKKSIGLRSLAFLIDFIMIYVVAGIMYLIFGFGTLEINETGFVYNLSLIEITLVSLIYFLLFALVMKGKTIGKLITRIEIKGIDLQEVSLKKIILREFIKSILIIISFISYIMLLSNRKKSIHDLIVDTMVVRKVKNNEIIYINQSNNNTEE